MTTHLPPEPERRPHVREFHGDRFEDPWFWLRDRDDPGVMAHLEAENAYADIVLAGQSGLREELFDEFRSRIQETDLSVPVARGPWWHYARTIEGEQYPIRCRTPRAAADHHPRVDDSLEGEQVLLDGNAQAGDGDYWALGTWEVSPDDSLVAWADDFDGDEVYRLRFRSLSDDGSTAPTDLDDQVEGISAGGAWAADSQTFFYLRLDEAHRPHEVWRHVLGTDPVDDVLVHNETDERFWLEVSRSRDDRFMLIHAGSSVTDEVWTIPADRPFEAPRVVSPRRQGIEYRVDHHDGQFVILTNDQAETFRVVTAPDTNPGPDHWTELVADDPTLMINGLGSFRDHLVLAERRNGVQGIRVRRWADGTEWVIEQPEEVSTADVGSNPQYDSTLLRYGYSSMVTPSSVYDYDLETRERTLLKQQPVLGGVDLDAYRSERLWATAPDGTQVPVSIVWRPDRRPAGPGPVVLYGYGSYEISMDPGFSPFRLSLLDRGVAFAIAHIRGGGEMGRRWYLEGKELNKINTFTDFVACGRHLVESGWAQPGQIVARGGSAGGLLMGAVLNMDPGLWAGVVAEVPFVDALSTITDPSLPLTVIEWEEWGNPVDSAEVYAYMKSYTPYENIPEGQLPAVLATAGLSDPRVGYWEPAKWVARLRERGQGGERVLLRTKLGAGHGGPSGRYDAWRDEALVMAFLLANLDPQAIEGQTCGIGGVNS
ncbi:MAG: S9 family peptidase [Actinomycetia bacterium]|nr:S9 family peptidase [Actinomycetes bacterium]MCP4086391.1 S9 family peptidase [Actinomycetes bacterium]